MYKVMFVGYGFVGSAVGSIFSNNEKVIIDPKYNDNKIKDYVGHKFDVVFVSVDTPKAEGFKLLDSVLEDLNANIMEGTVVCCKSTASPEFYHSACKKYTNIKIVHSPEYLNNSDPINMFQGQKFFIIGGDEDAAMTVGHIFKSRLNHVKNIRYTDIRTAALVKYAENSFLALKVTFFNELYIAHQNQGCESSFLDFAEMVGLDERIGQSHTKVPGNDGTLGWDSHCFNKDVYEMEKFTGSYLLRFLRNLNNQHRNPHSTTPLL